MGLNLVTLIMLDKANLADNFISHFQMLLLCLEKFSLANGTILHSFLESFVYLVSVSHKTSQGRV